MANTLTFANQTLTDTNIYGGISYICDLNTGEEFSIGNTASACVSFVTDAQVPIYTKDQTNGFFEWEQDSTSRGTYYVTEAKKVNGSWYEVTAYDAMILLDTSVSALSLTYPLTVSAAASAVATYLGCSIVGTIYNGTQSAQDGTIDDTVSIRKLLGWAAEASGASVKIDASGDIAFLYYDDSGITITPADYVENGLDVADYTCAAIDNVTICDMAGMTAATAGSGTNSLFIQGNPFLYDATNTEAAVILGLVEDFEYAPFTCSMFDENGLDVGVVATFGTVSSLVMHIESSESGAVASAVGSDSRAELNKSLEIIVNEAMAVASDAQQTAEALNLHFWYTALGSEAGAHIAKVDKPTFEANPSGGNLLSSSNGIAVRDGLTELATFGANGVVIGENANGKSRSELSTNGMQITQKDSGGNDVQIANLGYGLGNAQSGTAMAPYFTFGKRASGSNVGNNSVAEGFDTTASASRSHAEGHETTASAHAAHAEGNATTASGSCAHAEGEHTVASGTCAHAEGEYTVASGEYSHAEGYHTTASGNWSYAAGIGTIAAKPRQYVIGEYNVEDTSPSAFGEYAFIIGNGTAAAHSNALAVDRNGGILMGLPKYQTSGSEDKALYDAINALGWVSDVIE